MKKRFLSMVLTFAMVISLLPAMTISVRAETITDVDSSSALTAAISAASKGDRIRLTSDITLDGVHLQITNDIILDLNNYNISHINTLSSQTIQVDNNANLEITDSSTTGGGTITNNNSTSIIINRSTGTIKISGGTVFATNNLCTPIDNNGGGNVEICGGTVSAKDASAISSYAAGSNVTFTSGTVSVTGGTAFSFYNPGTVTISGGTVSAENGTLFKFDSGGSATVNGDTIITSNTLSTGTSPTITQGIIFEGGNGTVYGDVSLPVDLTINSNQSLTIPNGSSLSVSGSISLTNDGTITNKGTLINDGLISGSGLILNGGAVEGNGILGVLVKTGIFGAKFYQNQLWDVQRSPAFPIANKPFTIKDLSTPFDQNLNKLDFSGNKYVCFEPVTSLESATTPLTVGDLSYADEIVEYLQWYLDDSTKANEIKASALVNQVLYNADGTVNKILSEYGIVWALENKGFLYTSLPNDMGTFISMTALNPDDTITYIPEKSLPYTKDDIDEKIVAPEKGDSSSPATATFDFLGRVIDSTNNPITNASVTFTYNGSNYNKTTDTDGRFSVDSIPKTAGEDTFTATVEVTGYAMATYADQSLPIDGEAVFVYNNPILPTSGNIDNHTITITKSGMGTGTVTPTVSQTVGYGNDLRVEFVAQKGNIVSSVKIDGSENQTALANGYHVFRNVSSAQTIEVIFEPITSLTLGNVKFSWAQLFDVQRSPAFPASNRLMYFSGLKAPYNKNLNKIIFENGDYIKFECMESVSSAGLADSYYNSIKYYSGATKANIQNAALVKEVLYNSSNQLKAVLGTGMIWAYDDPTVGFMFTAMDGALSSRGGVGTLITCNATRVGSSVSMFTDNVSPLPYSQFSVWKPMAKPDGDILPPAKGPTIDYGGIVLDATGNPKVGDSVTLDYGGNNYSTTTDSDGRFKFEDLPYVPEANGKVTIGSDVYHDVPLNIGGDFGNDVDIADGNRTNNGAASKDPVFIEGQLTPNTGYTIAVTSGTGGKATQTTATVSYGSDLPVYFVADSNYTLKNITIDGSANVGALANNGFVFKNITSNHHIEATFQPHDNGISNNGTSNGGNSNKPQNKKDIVIDNKSDIVTEKVAGDTTTVTIDNEKFFSEIMKGSEGSNFVFDVKANTMITVQLVVRHVEQMAKKDMILTVTSGDTQFNINTKAVDVPEIKDQFPGVDTSKIPFVVVIQKTDKRVTGQLNGTAAYDYTAYALYNNKRFEIKEYTAFINREMAVTGSQANRITTALIERQNGIWEHVPTYVYQKSGNWYARINTRTNSTYALVYNEISFSDAGGKWYENAVNEMGSRKIINGVGENMFAGDRDITRAEFAAIVVRALGLPTNEKSNFIDVHESAWYSGAVMTAAKYGIVNGMDNERFDPLRPITRQEAMTMVMRAAKLTPFPSLLNARNLKAEFSDYGTESQWANDAIVWNLNNHLITGSNGNIRPLDNISRAETATVILRLLQRSELVDVRSKI